jgi:hypothetical protein
MAYLVEFPVGDGEAVVVEMDEEQIGFVPAAVEPGKVAAKAAESFEAAIDKLLPALRTIEGRVRQLGPDEVSVAVGVKLSTEAGAIIAKATAEANFTVTLKWTPGSAA